MDYDDNDFQSQNLRLAGEGSNKFPPVLRPYALPKFEFDDNLHGPLRYDSLVETEVFLGIESNEDSQWIEDYSRGNNAIEFASSAAETCCISRQNNVWSEATSSESVEMLLRSVGHEENIPVQTSAKKSDACDELGCMINQMEPSLKQDSNLPNRAVDFVDVQQTLPSSDVSERFPALHGDVEGQQPLDQNVSEGHDGGTCYHDGLGDLTAVVVGGEMSVTVESQFIDSKCDSVSQSVVNTVGYESLAVRTQESDAPGMQVDRVDTEMISIENINDENEDVPNKMAGSSAGCNPTDEINAGDSKEEMNALNEDAKIGLSQEISDAAIVGAGIEELQSHVCSIPVEYVSETNTSGSNLSNKERPCTSMTDEDLSANVDANVSIGSESVPLVSVDGREITTQDGSSSVSQLRTDSFVTSSVVLPILEGHGASADGTERWEVPHAKELEGIPVASAAESLQGHERQMVPKENEDHRLSLDEHVQQNKSSESPSNHDTANNKVHSSLITDRNIESLPSVSIEDKVTSTEPSVDPASGNVAVGSTDPDVVKASLAQAMGSAQTLEEVDRDVSIFGTSEGTAIVDPVIELEKGVSGESEPFLKAHVGESLTMADECSREVQIQPEATHNSGSIPESIREKDKCSVPQISGKAKDDASIVKETEEKASMEAQEIHDSSLDACQKGQLEEDAVLSLGTNEIHDAITDRNECGATTADAEKQSDVSPVAPTTEQSEVLHQRGEINRDAHISTLSTADSEKLSVALPVAPTVEQSEVLHQREEISTDALLSTSSTADANMSCSQDSKRGASSKDDGSFTFQVAPLTESPQVEQTKGLHLIQTAEPSKVSVAMDVSPCTSGLGQMTESLQVENTNKLQLVQAVEPSSVSVAMDVSTLALGSGQLDGKIVQDISNQSPKVSDMIIPQVGPKGSSERKPRRRATGKESAKRGKTSKEITPAKMERGNKAIITPSSSVVAERVQSNEMQRFGHTDNSGIKPFVGTSIPGLPDLNSSASAMAFQQPFTDTQQVQLRAQIFAYGALIQGTAPEEPYMISAFGGPDGGKSAWEKPWRLFVERLNGQRTHLNTPETPMQAHSVARVPDQSSNKQSTRKGKATSSAGRRSSSKATTTAFTSPILSLSSPLWNVPTPSGDHLQSIGMARGPVLDFQRTLSPLPSHQSPSFRNLVGQSPWIPQGHFGPWMTSSQTSSVDSTGGRFTVQMPNTEPIHLTPVKESAVMHVSTPLVSYTDPSGKLLNNSPMPDVGKTVISSGQQSTIPKPRKRKKSLVPENTLPQPAKEIIPAAMVASHPPTPIAITTPVNLVSKGPSEMHSANFGKADQRNNSSDDALGKVKEARAHAEDAAAVAATAISQSQEIWSRLDQQKNAGFSPDVEAKLASAALAIAAAAAVAKAAAAAANVAANAALQARLMADEAAASGRYTAQTAVISFSGNLMDSGNATPGSILQRDNGTSSNNLIILAARETARKRVEAASAASKRAENMDAIIRAAELATEAVSQAGKIVAMGDHPLPLSQLVAAGPEGYWRDPQVNDRSTGNLNVHGRGGDMPVDSVRSPKEGQTEKSIAQTEMSSGKDSEDLKVHKASETARTLEVVLEDGNGPKSPTTSENENVDAAGSSKGSVIREGTSVEVFRDGDGFKAAWFSAKVLDLRDEMAHVIYDELVSGEEKLKDWVALRGEGAEAPKIRISRPLTAMPFEGTRKRRRAAINDYNWSVGDKVDAWVRESWWEGVVTEKNMKDETYLTVRFPAQGQTLVVRAWHLRPSLLWQDGEWIEWSNLQPKRVSSSNVGDTPQEKRPRMRSPARDKALESTNVKESGKPDEPTLLNLGSEETVFNIGGNGSRPTARSGLQKEGSKAVFGVPKPGKKRKFMEVSKHYVGGRADRKTDEVNEPAKSTRYSSMSQGSGPRGWRSTTSKTDPSEKRAVVAPPKSKLLPKPGKPSAFTDNTTKAKSSSGGVSEKQSSTDRSVSSSGDQATEAPIVFSAVSRRSDPVSSKKPSTTNARSARGFKGKITPAAGKLGTVEEGKAFTSAAASSAAEPRRSVRRIQPTSRLLEGLQSSLMVSKIPSVSHDKSQKSRTAVRGNNNG